MEVIFLFFLLVSLAVWIGIGYWCYSLAKKNGRRKVLAFVLGLLFGIWAVLGYYIAGKK